VAAGLAFAAIAIGAVTGIMPRPTIIALATIPLALQCVRQLGMYYDQPYALMPAMQTNIRLHLFTGLLLLGGYLVAIIAGALMEDPPSFLV
jgi:1,4-dihydroxy-2-naphthoate octaprenyltransferase